MKSLENITTYIESNEPKEKEDRLMEKIGQISLVYTEKKFQEIKNKIPDYKFSDALQSFSPVKNIILAPAFDLRNFNFKEYQEKIDLFLNDFYDEVDLIFENEGFNLDKISDLISLKKSGIKEYLKVEDFKIRQPEKSEEDTKVIKFNLLDNINEAAEKKYKILEQLGFSENDKFIEVHFENFFSTGEKNLGPELIKKDLTKIAEYIIDKEPQTAAIIGHSWLLDSPVARLLDFKKIEDDNVQENDFSTWFQFIDRTGQIDNKRFNEFLKTEKLPFKGVKAYILTEEFLRKYLPENRKGKITLKIIDRDKESSRVEKRQEIQILKETWEELQKNNRPIEEFTSNKNFEEILGFVDPNDQKKYLDFFREMYAKKIPFKDFKDNTTEDIMTILKKIDKVMENSLYKDKEVII